MHATEPKPITAKTKVDVAFSAVHSILELLRGQMRV